MVPRKFLYWALGLAMIFFSNAGAVSQTLPGRQSAGSDAAALQANGEESGPVWPFNITVAADLKPFFRLMLKRSPTFRRQWHEISRAKRMRLRVVFTPQSSDCRCRAMSIVKRYAGGFRQITIYLYPPRAHDPEIIAHEFEHVLEQAEGLDLKALAEVNDSGVRRREDGSFETRRARRAGCQAADEFYSFREPELQASRAIESGGQ